LQIQHSKSDQTQTDLCFQFQLVENLEHQLNVEKAKLKEMVDYLSQNNPSNNFANTKKSMSSRLNTSKSWKTFLASSNSMAYAEHHYNYPDIDICMY
jgi:hypothetical protein